MSSNQLVCIKRPEPGLSAMFEDMYLNERLVDVTLSCCDGQLQAHKLVLAACSSYFSGLFDKLANPFHYPVIVIKDMQIDDLKLIVDFMYRGQLTVSQERLMTLVKSAQSLQINGLSNVGGLISSNLAPRDGTINSNHNGNNGGSRFINQRLKRAKKTASSTTGSAQHQATFVRAYQLRPDEIDSSRLGPQPDKLLEQSMTTGESIDDNHHFSYAANEDPTSTRNLTSGQQQLHSPSPTSVHVQHISSMSQQHNHQHQQQLTNQLQVLSHSLAANRSSLVPASNQQHSQSSQMAQHSRGRVHPCNICWKTFREKANLKRHLQVHSLDRIIYACPDCNKTFSWKDNYIRHTKTAHHINNVRPQA